MAKIAQKFEHSLTLNEIIFDTGDESVIPAQQENGRREFDKQFGYLYPVASLAGQTFTEDIIMSMNINMYGKLPQLSISLLLMQTNTLNRNLLKDKEVISIFCRSANPAKKEIHIDFLITSFIKVDKGDKVKIIINGEMFIPRLYASLNSAYNGTSYVVLQNIAQELKLGFASNLQSTDDSMIWIASNQNYFEFLNHIVEHAWVSDVTFVDWYIDVYYNVVFYDVNTALKYESTEVKAYKANVSANTTSVNDDEILNAFDWENMLTDINTLSQTDHGYMGFKVINNTELCKNGYIFNNYLFDYIDVSIVNFTAESISDITEGSPLKGLPDNTDYTDEIVTKYLGMQNDNMHPNYQYAVIHNYINNIELNKINIEVDVDVLNLNYTVGDNIFLQVSETRLDDGNLNAEIEAKNTTGKEIVNQVQYTNSYKVHGMQYIYKGKKIYNKYLLTRREWPIEAT